MTKNKSYSIISGNMCKTRDKKAGIMCKTWGYKAGFMCKALLNPLLNAIINTIHERSGEYFE